MKKTVKNILSLVLSLSFMGLTGCKEKENLTKVKMACNPFVGMAPFYVAMDKGYFKAEGIDFEKVDFDDSSNSCSALVSGSVDFAYVTMDSAIITASQSEKPALKVFSVVDESYGADGILAKNDITSIADFKGKNVGVSISQTSHYLLLKALKTVGLSDEDMNLINMTASDAGVAFMTGNLDVAVTWEPYLSNAVSTGAGKMIFSSIDAPGAIVDVMIISPENASAQWLPAVKKAYDKGLAFIRDSATKAEAVKITAKYLETDEAEAEGMIDTVKLYTFDEASAALKKGAVAYNAVNDISDFYCSKKIISEMIKPEDIIAE